MEDDPFARTELIEGELIPSPSAKAAHACVIDRIRSILQAQLAELGNGLVVLTETGWNLNLGTGRDSVPVPDVIVVQEADFRNAIREDSWLSCQPLLVVEVVSPTERKSKRLQKVGLYLEAGPGPSLKWITKSASYSYIDPTTICLSCTKDQTAWNGLSKQI